jgi:hypothetical protein
MTDTSIIVNRTNIRKCSGNAKDIQVAVILILSEVDEIELFY